MKRILFCILVFTLNCKEVDWWDGNYYTQHAKLQHNESFSVIERLALQSHESVLDVGCGDGKLTNYMALCVDAIIGIDKSPKMIEQAQKRHPSNCSFQVMDATNITINQKFDVVACLMCLHYIQEQQTALNNMFHVLKKGGRLALRTTYDDYAFAEAIIATAESEPYASYLSDIPTFAWLLTEKSLNTMLTTAGFSDCSLVDKQGEAQITDREACAQWLKTFLPYAAYLPSELVDQFYFDVVDYYIKQHQLVSTGPIAVKRHWLEVIAYKS